MNSTLAGKVALVTGGSRGIGRSVCVALAKSGAKVYVNYASNSAAADETVKLCEPGSAQVLGFDVANGEAVEQAFDTIKQKEGRIDILVNNAGITSDGLFIRMKDEDWHRTLGINLNGAFFCSRAAAKMMMKARSGRIINMSSVVGQMGNPGQVAYVSSKAGIIGMTKAMARELASRGITVNAVAPGYIDTDMTRDLDAGLKEKLNAEIPLGRTGQPEEIAAAVAFLASDMAGYITGQVIGVNGGLYM